MNSHNRQKALIMNASNGETGPHTVVFDIETRKLAKDVGGWANLKRGDGGVSAVVVWDNVSRRSHIYDQHTLSQAADHLENADVVLSFNGEDFDVPVLQGVLGRRLSLPVHLDLLQLVWARTTGRRFGNKLDELAQRTLGSNKSADGTLAPALADEGRWGELFEYCALDVQLTRDLFSFAQKYGGCITPNGEILLLDLPDWFEKVKF